MDVLRGFLGTRALASIDRAIMQGYKTAQDLQNPPLSVQLMRKGESGQPEPVGFPFQPIRIRFGLREVTEYGEQTPIVTARADADMLVWGVDPNTGVATDESSMRVNDYLVWTSVDREHTARVSAVYPTDNFAMNVEIELVQ